MVRLETRGRISSKGSSYLATLPGANFPAIVVDMTFGKPVSVPLFSEITVVVRYFEEIIIKN